MAKRKKIPSLTETELLTSSTRRCCLCFGLNHVYKEKNGQIAHLDHDPSNNKIDNLCWLCLEHHDSYDSKNSQSKGYTIKEVKAYRKQLYEKVDELRYEAYSSQKESVKLEEKESEDNSGLFEELRILLNHINPEIIARIDQGHKTISVMIGMPKLMMLQQLSTEPNFNNFIQLQPTGNIIMGGSGNRIGNAINDIDEGFMQGYMLHTNDRMRK